MKTARLPASPAISKRLGKKNLNHISQMCVNVYNPMPTHYTLPSSTYYEHYLKVDLQKNVLGDQGHLNVIIGVDTNQVTICFSGTDDLEFWLYNTDTEVTLMKPNGVIYYVHQGFYELAVEILAQLETFLHLDVLEKGREVVFCGHSAGGAAANLIALELVGKGVIKREKTTVVDFGCPRFWAANNKVPWPISRFSFRNYYDIVPDVPFRWLTLFKRFKDTEREVVWLDPSGEVPPPSTFKRILNLLLSGTENFPLSSQHSMKRYDSRILAFTGNQ